MASTKGTDPLSPRVESSDGLDDGADELDRHPFQCASFAAAMVAKLAS